MKYQSLIKTRSDLLCFAWVIFFSAISCSRALQKCLA